MVTSGHHLEIHVKSVYVMKDRSFVRPDVLVQYNVHMVSYPEESAAHLVQVTIATIHINND